MSEAKARKRRERAESLIGTLEFQARSVRRRRARALIEFEENLKRDLVETRKQRKLTQQQVADLLGVEQATISSFEDINNDPKLSTIVRYAHAVGATIAYNIVELHELAQAAEPTTRISRTLTVRSFTSTRQQQEDSVRVRERTPYDHPPQWTEVSTHA